MILENGRVSLKSAGSDVLSQGLRQALSKGKNVEEFIVLRAEPAAFLESCREEVWLPSGPHLGKGYNWAAPLPNAGGTGSLLLITSLLSCSEPKHGMMNHLLRTY